MSSQKCVQIFYFLMSPLPKSSSLWSGIFFILKGKEIDVIGYLITFNLSFLIREPANTGDGSAEAWASLLLRCLLSTLGAVYIILPTEMI